MGDELNCSLRSRGLNSNVLKLIAIIAMTIDHITWVAFPGYPTEEVPIILHLLGRITCPIMCFFIAEGYHYTRDVKKYTARLFIFAFISHFAYVFTSINFVDWKSFIPFYYGSFLDQTSIMWSLAWGLVLLRVVNSIKIKSNLLKVVYVILICVIALPSDWSCIAALCVLAFGTNRGRFGKQIFWLMLYVSLYAAVYFFAIDYVYGVLQLGVVLSVPLLMLYNGKRGNNPKMNKIMKWGFYIYYPLHLVILGIIKCIINN